MRSSSDGKVLHRGMPQCEPVCVASSPLQQDPQGRRLGARPGRRLARKLPQRPIVICRSSLPRRATRLRTVRGTIIGFTLRMRDLLGICFPVDRDGPSRLRLYLVGNARPHLDGDVRYGRTMPDRQHSALDAMRGALFAGYPATPPRRVLP
jgi:hypothetical protein